MNELLKIIIVSKLLEENCFFDPRCCPIAPPCNRLCPPPTFPKHGCLPPGFAPYLPYPPCFPPEKPPKPPDIWDKPHFIKNDRGC